MTKEELEEEAYQYDKEHLCGGKGARWYHNVTIREAYLASAEPREKRIDELEAQVEKMKDCLNRWYSQHNADDYTETFYESLLRDTEKCLWGDSVK